MDLPKLYRVVYLEIEWLTDTCEGGEHVQRSGTYYVSARLVLNDRGGKFWQILNKDFKDIYFENDDLEYNWHNRDLHYHQAKEKYKHHPDLVTVRQTIKQQKKDIEDQKRNSKNSLFANLFTH